MELERNNIAKIISDLRENKINGINVTVPFKKDVIPFLDGMSDIAKETNSVNTIYKKEAKVIDIKERKKFKRKTYKRKSFYKKAK